MSAIEPVLLARRGDELFAVGSKCPHYGGPLAEGLMVGETVRCPWHHACFSLRSGEVLRAPARDPLPRWRVEVSDGIAYARERIERQPRPTLGSTPVPESVVIIGGGPAGNMAAETLRDEGYAGPITMLSADTALPADRPNLSKDYLAGRAPEEWTLLRSADFYQENAIDVRLNTRVDADRHWTICSRARRRQPSKLRRASACHRRRAGQARRSGRGPRSCSLSAHARRQPRAACKGRKGPQGGDRRRELHRS